jgi:Flp pilus assembly protein TadB
VQNILAEEKAIESHWDYNEYSMSIKEWFIYSVIAGLLILAVAYVFYHSLIFSAFLSLTGVLYPGFKKKSIIKKNKTELNIQFKDMLYSLSSSISAGRSIELAFKEVLKDLSIQYPDPETSIIKEVDRIIQKVNMNETVEDALLDFASRAHLEDIDNFVDVFLISKRTGGNIVEIIKNSSNIINDKIEIKMEIETMLAERKFEQKVLNIVPIVMIVILSETSRDYMMPIFTTLAGRASMTLCVILLIVSFLISSKIMDISI